MSNPREFNGRAWLYLLATFFVVSFVVRYGFRLLSQLRGAGAPSLFAQVLTVLMIGFAAIILFGYWSEYRAYLAREQPKPGPSFGRGCLLILVIVACFACGLLVLAWQMFRQRS